MAFFQVPRKLILIFSIQIFPFQATSSQVNSLVLLEEEHSFRPNFEHSFYNTCGLN